MASADTLELLLIKRLKLNRESAWNAPIVEIGLALFTVMVISMCVWYLFWGPGLMDLYPSMRIFLIQALSALPTSEAHQYLQHTLENQGYVSVMQTQEIVDLVKLDIDHLVELKQASGN